MNLTDMKLSESESAVKNPLFHYHVQLQLYQNMTLWYLSSRKKAFSLWRPFVVF